jgi:quinol monooxygenase YgiN
MCFPHSYYTAGSQKPSTFLPHPLWDFPENKTTKIEEVKKMLIVLAKVSVKPEKKSELLNLVKGVMATTQAEPGCISYTLMDNPHESGACLFVEEWESPEALKKHGDSAHIAAWRQQSAPLLSAKTVIKIYQAEEFKF